MNVVSVVRKSCETKSLWTLARPFNFNNSGTTLQERLYPKLLEHSCWDLNAFSYKSTTEVRLVD